MKRTLSEEKIVESITLRPNTAHIDKDLVRDMVLDCIDDLRDMLHYEEDEDLPKTFESTVKNSVLAAINKIGAEGISSQSFSGVSFSFRETLSDTDLRKIKSKRRFL